MKLSFTRLVLLLGAAFQTQAGDLTVVIDGLRSTNGMLRVALFEAARGFPADVSFACANRSLPLEQHPQGVPVAVVFTNLQNRKYAVSVLHDENKNGKLDKSVLGIPKEGTGASNNPDSRMGPPGFDEASLALEEDLRIPVTLLYHGQPPAP